MILNLFSSSKLTKDRSITKQQQQIRDRRGELCVRYIMLDEKKQNKISTILLMAIRRTELFRFPEPLQRTGTGTGKGVIIACWLGPFFCSAPAEHSSVPAA